MNSITPIRAEDDATRASSPNPFYFAAWRWHFYAGLYVIPFLIMLAVTGLMMLWIALIDGRDGEWIAVEPQSTTLAVSNQAQSAIAAIPNGELRQYIAPRADDLAAIFRVDTDTDAIMVAVDPYTGTVLNTAPRRAGWYDFADNLHSDLMIGVTGDRMIEIAASLAMVLVATGLYLWWPRDTSFGRAMIPNFAARGRALWKTLHATVGAWVSIILIFFLISGLSWAGIWGEKFMQAWNTFPAAKFDAPLSDSTHASMNHGSGTEVPWTLEQTPMPASGSDAGIMGLPTGTQVTLDTVTDFARNIGFKDRFQLNIPNGTEGVWTISKDSMSNDSTDPMGDRTVHIDQYSGKILGDVNFEDYSIYAKSMAVGVSLHMGTMGIANIAVNTLFCLSVIFLSVSGVVLWWKRRPSKAGRLSAPPMPQDVPLWKGAMLVGLIVSMAFPLAGLTLVAVLAVDYLLLSRVPVLKRAFS